MRICIHRGAEQIGGSCVEIEAEGSRIVIDLGLPLDAVDVDAALLPPVRGLLDPDDPSLLAVVLSHGHRDHWGLLPVIRDDLRVILGEATHRILSAAAPFVPGTIAPTNVQFLRDRQPLTLGPFRITPFLIDHSAYDAYALLFEAGGKRLLYTGDLRAHGRKASLFERLVKHPPQNIDVMLMEGTSIGRDEENSLTEAALEDALVAEFDQTEGAILFFASPQNIDRMVSIYRACKRTQRSLVVDLYAAEILRATGNENVPQTTWPNVDVFIPQSQRQKIKNKGLFEQLNWHHRKRIYLEQLKTKAARSVFLCRASMLGDFERGDCLSGARAIWSQWSGYLKGPDGKVLSLELEQKAIPLKIIHASGHASVHDLQRLAAAIAPKALVPIHTFRPASYRELFDNVRVHQDGEWWDVKQDTLIQLRKKVKFDQSEITAEQIIKAYEHTEGLPVRTNSLKSQGRKNIKHTAKSKPHHEKPIAKALYSLGSLTLNDDITKLRWLDYEVPLKNVNSDEGVGDIDLLGVIDQLFALVELKTEGNSEHPGDVLLQVLSYGAIVAIPENFKNFKNEYKEQLPKEIKKEIQHIILAYRGYWDRYRKQTKLWNKFLQICIQLRDAKIDIRCLILNDDQATATEL
jgi:ribonuclease J